MYKLTVSLGWDETVTIETDDFNKIALIQEFIAEMEDANWDVEDDYSFEDEDGVIWYYDEESDEWYSEDDEEESDEEEDEEEEDEEDYS